MDSIAKTPKSFPRKTTKRAFKIPDLHQTASPGRPEPDRAHKIQLEKVVSG